MHPQIPSLIRTHLSTVLVVTTVPVLLVAAARVMPLDLPTGATSAQVAPAGPGQQSVEPQTTIAGGLQLATAAERNRKITVSSAKGKHVWTASALAEHDLPSAAMRAYRRAAVTINSEQPGCHLPWSLLAGIGRVESDHGRYGGSTLGSDGVPRPAIVGIALNGVGPVAAIHDTDGGRFDGDTVWDRAVGPMQFIPSTWAGSGRDGDGDGVKSPNDIDDAALASAGYLCHGARDLSQPSDQRAAIYSYNASEYYVDLVSAFARGYGTGTFVIPSPQATAADGDGVVHLRPAASSSPTHLSTAKKAKAKAATAKAAKAKAAKVKAAKAKAAKAKAAKAKAAKAKAAKAKAAKAKPAKAKPATSKPKPAPTKPKPATSKPKPTPTKPAPTEPAPTKPAPTKPAPTPQPTLQTAKGPVLKVSAGWSIGGVVLSVTNLTGLADTDWDADGTKESVSDEFDGLVVSGVATTLTYVEKPHFAVEDFSVDPA